MNGKNYLKNPQMKQNLWIEKKMPTFKQVE